MPTKYEWANIALFVFTIWWSQTQDGGFSSIILLFLVLATIVMYLLGFALGKDRDWLERDLKKRANKAKKREIELKER